jgi:hypothetical protein
MHSSPRFARRALRYGNSSFVYARPRAIDVRLERLGSLKQALHTSELRKYMDADGDLKECMETANIWRSIGPEFKRCVEEEMEKAQAYVASLENEQPQPGDEEDARALHRELKYLFDAVSMLDGVVQAFPVVVIDLTDLNDDDDDDAFVEILLRSGKKVGHY